MQKRIRSTRHAKLNPEWYINFIKNKVLPIELDRQKRRTVRTVIERIQSAADKYNLHPVSDDDKAEIGRLVKDTFFASAENLYLRHEDVLEPVGKVSVLSYPSKFVPVMDSILFKYFKLLGKIVPPISGIETK
jgi:hypothetical protein